MSKKIYRPKVYGFMSGIWVNFWMRLQLTSIVIIIFAYYFCSSIIVGGGGLVTKSCLTLVTPQSVLCPWNSPGRNTRVGCHFLLQGRRAIFVEGQRFFVEGLNCWRALFPPLNYLCTLYVFLDSPFCFIDLYVYPSASTTQSWNWARWVLPFYSAFLKLLYLFWVLCLSI